jgi:hypothetical protein
MRLQELPGRKSWKSVRQHMLKKTIAVAAQWAEEGGHGEVEPLGMSLYVISSFLGVKVPKKTFKQH